MKRFLSLLTVFLLAFTLAVPVGAANNSIVNYNGMNVPSIDSVWTDKATYPFAAIAYSKHTKTYELYLVEKDVRVQKNDVGYYVNPSVSSKILWYRLDTESNKWNLLFDTTYSTSQTLFSSYDYTNVWVSRNLSYGSTVVFNYTDPVVPLCDGSSCPATDVNFDDICDECGAPLAYNLRVTPNEYSIVVKHADGTTLRFSFTETIADTAFDAVYSDNRITVTFDNPVNHKQYKLVDGEWTDYASYPNIYGYHSINLPDDATILASDLYVYDENGELFFRNPLWMTVEKVTQGEMENLTSEMGGTMKTLVVCGVGLMACLMALSLFGKRWLIFLR